MPNAAAERMIAPTFVGFITLSSITILLLFSHNSLTEGKGLRFMAHSIPLVSLKPVSCVRTSNAAQKTGTSCIRSRIGLPSPSICRFSIRHDTGSYPASSARSMTFGLSAINNPCAGQSLFSSCASVNRAYTSNSGARKSVISIRFDMLISEEFYCLYCTCKYCRCQISILPIIIQCEV